MRFYFRFLTYMDRPSSENEPLLDIKFIRNSEKILSQKQFLFKPRHPYMSKNGTKFSLDGPFEVNQQNFFTKLHFYHEILIIILVIKISALIFT